MDLAIPAFEYGASMPERFSKQGGNVSPALIFRDVPRHAGSLALIMDDPDAPHGLFTHWLVYNIDASVTGFPEKRVPGGAMVGKNSWGEAAYGGPQPPDREHRYFFRLFALNDRLPLRSGASRAELERLIDDHLVARAEYVGRYAPHAAELKAR